MKLAQHIKIARREGVEAGLEAYLASPGSRLHKERYNDIAKRRTSKTRLEAYCRVFAKELGDAPSRIPVVQEQYDADVQGIVEAAVAQALRGILGNTPQVGTTDEPDEDTEGEMMVSAIMDEYGVPENVARKLFADGITVEIDDTDDNDTHSVRVPTSVANRGKRTRKAPEGAITAGEAWVALGGGDTFEPNDPDKEANNGQLYRLNVSGLLQLRS